ncbi:MAG: class I SAM-dependent methyltransferase [Clostridia bacterium]|nr:class I SAM-dependent methyltransferase [Clostridia bacterium]
MTKRQRELLNLIPQCNILCDVGCDHGIIGTQALVQHKVNQVVFVDISAPSLDKARILCNKLGLDKTTFICQDGLGNIECDCAVIAGMGGLEIINILSTASHLPPTLLLQPMRDVIDVRQYVCNNYRIMVDRIIYDKKYYNIILLTSGTDTLSRDELLYGRTNLSDRSEDFVKYLHNEIRKYKIITKQTNKKELVDKLIDYERVYQQGDK